MAYNILTNPDQVRADFVKEHLICEAGTKHMWEVLRKDASEISFEEALTKLHSVESKVNFISEAEGNHSFNNCALEEYEEDKKGFAASSDSEWLSEMLDYEWYNKGQMWEEGFNLASNDILPDDVYVFDEGLDWFLVFTHQWDGENPKNRLCFAYNI